MKCVETLLCVAGPGNGSPGVAGGGGAGGTSEYVRNELRAVVGARSARPDLHQLQPPDMDSLMSFDIAPPGQYIHITNRRCHNRDALAGYRSTVTR